MQGSLDDLQSKIVHLHWPYTCGVGQGTQRQADLSGLSSDFDKDLNVLMNGAKLKIGGFVLQKSYRFLVCRSSLQA